MRSLAPYLDGFKESGRSGWNTAKCPAHNGESFDSLHVNRDTGGFLCLGGCSPPSIYQATKAQAIAAGYRFEVVSPDPELAQEIEASLNVKSSRPPKLFDGELGAILEATAENFNLPREMFEFVLLPILGSQICPRVRLMLNPGTNHQVPALRFCGLLGDSGVRKSPIINSLSGSIKQAQHELAQDFRERKAAYKLAEQKWKSLTNDEKRKHLEDGEGEPEEPIESRDLYMDDFTMESIAKTLDRYPDNGLLVSVDELNSRSNV